MKHLLSLLIPIMLSAASLRAASDPFTDLAPFPLGALGANVWQTQGSAALKVAAITSGSPAETAGLQVNDFIYGVNGERLSPPGNPHHDGWSTTGSQMGNAIARSETTNGALSLMVLRFSSGPLTLNATLPLVPAWRTSFPAGDPRMEAYYEKVCADFHTKIMAPGFFGAISNTSTGDNSDYYGPFYGLILLAHPDWNNTAGPKPYRLPLQKLKDRAIAYLNTRIVEPVQPDDPGYVNAGWDNWHTTAHAMFLGEYRRKYGADPTLSTAVQNAVQIIANRIQDTRQSIMGHGGVALVHAYEFQPADYRGLNIINAHAMLAMGILKGAGANFSVLAGSSGLTIEQKYQANWARLKDSTYIYNGSDQESLNEDGNLSYVSSVASGRVSDGAGGGWDSNARTPCAAAGYQIYLNAGGTAATTDDAEKLARMKAYTPRNWQRQHNNHGYSVAGTVFSQMLIPFLTERQQSYFRENSHLFFTLTRDHHGGVLYFPGRNNLGGDNSLGAQDLACLMPGMAWAVTSGNLPSFPRPAGANNQIFVRMNSPVNDWPRMEARRVKIVGFAKNLDLDVTDSLGVPVSSGFTAAWTMVSGGGVAFTNPNGLDTGVTFPGVGNYRLRLVVTTPNTSVTEDYDFEVATQVTPPNDSAIITRQPVSRICSPGDSVFFSVSVTGNGPFAYRWKFNGVDQAPTTSPVLSLPNVSRDQFGTYQCTILHPGGVLTSAPAELCPSGTFAVLPGGLKRELWNGLGASVNALTTSTRYPLYPDATSTEGSAEVPSEQGENFGERLSGWVIPPATGTYQFFLAADNGAQLWLSTDDSESHKVKIAEVGVTTYRQYSAGPSTAVSLVAGRRYYIEALHVESGYDDFLSIAWRKPGDPVPANGSAPIPGPFLESEQYIPESGRAGLLSHWRLDDGAGAVAVDSMASGNEGSINGATWTNGRHGGALHFDGSDDSVSVPNTAAMGGLMAFTVAAWVKLDSPTVFGIIVQQRPTDGLPPANSESGQYQLAVNGSGNVTFFCSGHSSLVLNMAGASTLNDGQWHHVAGVREANGDGKIYVDGKLDASASGSGYIWPLDVASNVGIGADISNDGGFFKGSIDDVRIYNRALTTPETSALAQSPFVRGWSRSPWTSDEDSGITWDTKWAYHFASTADTTIRGTTVKAVAGTAPAITKVFSIAGYTAQLDTDTNSLTSLTGSGSAVIGKSFLWSANPATFTIRGLTVGRNYVLTFLSCGWNDTAGRNLVFSSGGDTLNVNQDEYGNNNGIRVEYAFTADATSRVITATPVVPTQSFHCYALALRDEGTDATRPGAPWTGDNTAGIYADSAWAYHFGSATPATVDGRTVPGVDGANPSVAGKFSITGVPSVFYGDVNILTASGGAGSAVLAANYIHGGNAATVTLQGLVPGRKYVATFLTSGWENSGGSKLVFSSDSDRFIVDLDPFGFNTGNRVEYSFTADAATRVITIAPYALTPEFTLRLYALALRQGSIVTNPCDFGPSSLRQTLADAAVIPGADLITADPMLDGQWITLGSALTAAGPAPVIIDADSLPEGLSLLGAGSNRLIEVAPGATLSLRRLKLANGHASGDFPASYGGGIFAQGDLDLTDCSISDCSASIAGGAIAALGNIEVLLDRCAVFNNTAPYGGAVQNEASFIALTSTFAHNAATAVGGAISAPFNHNTLLKHCTLGQNSAGVSGGAHDGTGLLIENTIAAGNTAPAGPNLNGTPAAVGGVNILSGSAMLAPLGDYGGFTPTMPPLPGSPAVNASSSSLVNEPVDQRGFARSGIPDIGAAEYLGAGDLSLFWQDDWDEDGVANGVEFALGMDPTLPDPASSKNLKLVRHPNGISELTFGYNPALAADAHWVLESSTDLVDWSPVFSWDGANHFFGDTWGGLSGSAFTISTAQPDNRVFYRFKAAQAP